MVYPAVFPEEEFSSVFDPLTESASLVKNTDVHGVLIDTYNKSIGKGLLDYYPLDGIAGWAESLHSLGKEAWVAGSIDLVELPDLWRTAVDTVCVRAAACDDTRRGSRRFGAVTHSRVRRLRETLQA